MNKLTWHKIAILAGIATILISLSFAPLMPEADCGTRATTQTLSAWQFTHSQQALDALFGPVGSECRADLADGLMPVLWLDMLGYIAAFTLFTVAWHKGAHAASGLARFGIGAALLAALSDYGETAVELAQAANGGAGLVYSPTLDLLTQAKFVFIGVAIVIAGLRMIAAGGWMPRIFGLIAAGGGFFATLVPVVGDQAALGVLIGWAVMLGWSMTAVIRGRGPAPDNPASASPSGG